MRKRPQLQQPSTWRRRLAQIAAKTKWPHLQDKRSLSPSVCAMWPWGGNNKLHHLQLLIFAKIGQICILPQAPNVLNPPPPQHGSKKKKTERRHQEPPAAPAASAALGAVPTPGVRSVRTAPEVPKEARSAGPWRIKGLGFALSMTCQGIAVDVTPGQLDTRLPLHKQHDSATNQEATRLQDSARTDTTLQNSEVEGDLSDHCRMEWPIYVSRNSGNVGWRSMSMSYMLWFQPLGMLSLTRQATLSLPNVKLGTRS